MKYTASKPLVLSSSSLAAYSRCPRSYDFGYIRGYRTGGNRAANLGTSFHTLMREYLTGEYTDIGSNGEPIVIKGPPADKSGMTDRHEDLEMWPVFTAYVHHNHQNFPKEFIGAEYPIYSKLLPNVWLRTTYDLLSKDEEWYLDIDYKTHEKMESMESLRSNLDLDYQGRLFVAVMEREFKMTKCMRRYEHVRRTPPNVVKDKSGGKWAPEECYRQTVLRLGPGEGDRVWAEAQGWAEKLLWEYKRKDENKPGTFGRVALNGTSPYTCGSCFYKNLCATEASMGTIPESLIALEVIERIEPLTLPAGFLRRKKV